MADLVIPNADFVSGTVINSSQMDANFGALLTYLNTTGVAKYQAGTVDGAALASTISGTHDFTGANTFTGGGPRHAIQAFTDTGSIVATSGALVTVNCGAGKTVTLPAATNACSIMVFNIGSTNAVTIAGAGTDKVSNGGYDGAGVASKTILPGEGQRYISNTTNKWFVEILS